MKYILYKIPYILMYSRLVVSILMIIVSFIDVSSLITVVLCVYAIISDVFDGIIARHLQISTNEMRQLDTRIDTVFWFSCLIYLCINRTLFIQNQIIQIGLLVFSELFIIIFGFLKFQERISYHTVISKIWALLLLWFFIDLALNNSSQISFTVSFWFGILVQSEIIWIAFILDKNLTDVPGIVAALKLKKGLNISRNRFFNG